MTLFFRRHALLCFSAYFVRPTCLQNKSLMRTSTSPGTLLCSMPTVRWQSVSGGPRPSNARNEKSGSHYQPSTLTPFAPCQRSAKHSALLSISPQRRQPSPCQERCLTRSWWRSPRERVTCQGTVSVGEGHAGHIPGEIPKHPWGDHQDHGRLEVDCLHVVPWPVASVGARLLQGRFFPRSPTYM